MDPLLIIRSLRKSSLRCRSLRRLADRKRAYLSLLAEDLDVDLRDLKRMLWGKLPYYAPHLSPVKLGLVRVTKRGRRVELAITPLGEQIARRLDMIRGRR